MQQRDRHLWFRHALTLAREKQADFMAARTQDIAEEMYQRAAVTMPQVQAAKLLCENTRWYAGKVYRGVYGEEASNVNVGIGVQVTVPPAKLASIRERLEHARALVPPRGKETPADVRTDHQQLGDAPPQRTPKP